MAFQKKKPTASADVLDGGGATNAVDAFSDANAEKPGLPTRTMPPAPDRKNATMPVAEDHKYGKPEVVGSIPVTCP
jgi:hypothetical protein